MWATILTIVVKLMGAIISKRTEDREAKRRFLELANYLQQKKLISAKMKFERADRLTDLERKRKEAEARINGANN